MQSEVMPVHTQLSFLLASLPHFGMRIGDVALSLN